MEEEELSHSSKVNCVKFYLARKRCNKHLIIAEPLCIKQWHTPVSLGGMKSMKCWTCCLEKHMQLYWYLSRECSCTPQTLKHYDLRYKQIAIKWPSDVLWQLTSRSEEGLLKGSLTRSDRTSGNDFKLKEGTLDTKRELFTVRVVRHWHKLPR